MFFRAGRLLINLDQIAEVAIFKEKEVRLSPVGDLMVEFMVSGPQPHKIRLRDDEARHFLEAIDIYGEGGSS